MLGPETAHSPNAEDMNALYWVLLALAGIIFLLINGALVALALRFRARRGVQPRRIHTRPRAMFLLGGLLTTFAAIVFVAGVIVTQSASEVEVSGPDGLQASANRTAQRGLDLPTGDAVEPLQIEATGQQWLWRYEYPDGTFSYYELVVPVDTAVVVNLGSTDVVHRWWVPGLGGKFDAVPDQSNRTWFKADETGEFDGATYQFAGASGAAMRTKVVVLPVEEYQAWLEQQSDDIQEAQEFVQSQVEADTQLANPDGADPATAQ
ncbi:hypothetical protein BH20ACT15_BH20ACT15_12550 [soil metagenome]